MSTHPCFGWWARAHTHTHTHMLRHTPRIFNCPAFNNGVLIRSPPRVVGGSDGCTDMDGERFGGDEIAGPMNREKKNQVLLRTFPSKSMVFNFF